MFSYVAFGCGIRSELHLPELVADSDRAEEITIRLAPIARPIPGIVPGENGYHLTPDDAFLSWKGFGSYWMRNGREIIVEPAPEADECAIRAPLLGMCFAMLLVQRGLFVLHASAVVIDGEAIAFVGEKGQGKSTMAVTLYGRGRTLITDDVLVVDDSRSSGPALAMPSFPQFKLLPESIRSALDEDPSALPRIAALNEKRARHARERFSSEPVPLRRIYVLAEGPTPAVTPIDRQQAVVQLIAHSMQGRYGSYLLQGPGAAEHLRRCAVLAQQVEVCRLERPLALPLLTRVAELVEGHPDRRSTSTPIGTGKVDAVTGVVTEPRAGQLLQRVVRP
jgi:hypothetical protein